MTFTTPSNSRATLSDLAGQAARLRRRSIQNWLDCAAILAEAREIAAHGQWLQFLADAGIPNRTAQRMLRLHAAGIKCVTVTHLGGIRATLDFLATADRAMANWRAAVKEAEGSDAYSTLLQSAPGGPLEAIPFLDTPEDRERMGAAHTALSGTLA